MSAVVGIDLSTKALDLVKLDENTNRAEWVRVDLYGPTAWTRTFAVRGELSNATSNGDFGGLHNLAWWEDVYLIAIEAPYGHGSDILNRVVGAVVASLPAKLRDPARCWIVRPDEWKGGFGLKAKPGWVDVARIAPDHNIQPAGRFREISTDHWQNARDAYCLAMWARHTNARAVDKGLTA